MFFTQEHAGLGINETVDGNALRVHGRRYYTGLGTHSHSRVRYFLGGGYDLLTGSAGIDDEIGDRGSAVFEILVDGERRWSSGTLTGRDSARPFQIAVTGKRYLDLIVDDAGDGCDYDHADWLDPYLRVLPPSARPAEEAARTDRGADDQPTTQPVGEIPARQRVVIETSLGAIVVELDTERTEDTVRNFLSYVAAGSYDDTIIHRVIKDHIVQGGGYDARLRQMPAARPIDNQAEKAQSNRRGTIAMARQAEPDSATREFFFNLADNLGFDYPHHNGGYCVFGHVVDGMDILDQIGIMETRQVFQFEYLPKETITIRSIRRK
jgi:cyclophilin family peptidyl-prolyl cis-trans isomerase